MAERKAIPMEIIASDNFLMMPLSAQALYFHLAVHADEKGTINNVRATARAVRAQEADVSTLKLNNYVKKIGSVFAIKGLYKEGEIDG